MSSLPAAAAAATISSASLWMRDRLFDQHVLAGLERRNGHPAMGVVGNAQIDQINVGIRQHGLEIPVAGHAG